MARKKKATGAKPPAASRRTGERSAADLRAYIARMATQRGNLEALAQSMQELDVETVRLDGVMKIARGLDLVDDFALLFEMAIKRAKLAQDQEASD